MRALLFVVAPLYARAVFAQQTAPSDPEIHVLPVQGNVYMLAGAGTNIAVQAAQDGVLIVDTATALAAPKILAAIKTISNRPLRYIVNTSFDPDHTGGNDLLRKAGSTIAGGNVAGDLGASASEGAQIIAHDNVMRRMSAPTGKQAPTPSGAWPTDTFIEDEKKLWFDGEGIQILHFPNAHTDTDSIVFFRRSDVIATGDLFTTTDYPVIDVAAGGTINGFIDALNKILDLVITVYGQEGGTMLIPGHGRLCDAGDLINYREMATIIRDRVQDMVNKGMTLEQVKAAKPTRDYDPLYGSNPRWTSDMFVEAVYKTLKK
ncbi:MAG TPA: MBL fold metallo-hydrolase [Bryobacteraceae bacterium]|nr:MBL fold metallo-hydrolase [Bryobacteraceae bacterium]